MHRRCFFWGGEFSCTCKKNYIHQLKIEVCQGKSRILIKRICTGNQTWCVRKKMGYISEGKKQTVPGHKTAWSLGCDSSRFSGNLPASFFSDTKDGFGGRHGVTVGDLLFRADSPSTPVDGWNPAPSEVCPIICKVLYISGGAGFLPPTVGIRNQQGLLSFDMNCWKEWSCNLVSIHCLTFIALDFFTYQLDCVEKHITAFSPSKDKR